MGTFGATVRPSGECFTYKIIYQFKSKIEFASLNALKMNKNKNENVFQSHNRDNAIFENSNFFVSSKSLFS